MSRTTTFYCDRCGGQIQHEIDGRGVREVPRCLDYRVALPGGGTLPTRHLPDPTAWLSLRRPVGPGRRVSGRVVGSSL